MGLFSRSGSRNPNWLCASHVMPRSDTVTTVEITVSDLIKYGIIAYPIVHVLFGFMVHRKSLKECIAFNENCEKSITNSTLSALFLHRVLFGLPHRLLMILLLPLVLTVCLGRKIFAWAAYNKKVPFKFPTRLLTHTHPSYVGEAGTSALLWIWNIAICCGIAADVYWGWEAFIPLTILYCIPYFFGANDNFTYQKEN